jgi:DNA-binding MurR/RpiR family transcriptional regulator
MPLHIKAAHPLLDKISPSNSELTPKSRIIGNFIRENPRKAVFMTVAELAKACRVSEATVVRFVGQLGYAGYAEFQQSLRDLVDTQLTLLDRVELTDMLEPGAARFRRVVSGEIDNLRQLYESSKIDRLEKVVALLYSSPQIYVIGSRLSYALAYYMGWSLTKIRGGIQIFNGSDRTTIDWLTISPADVLVIIITLSRYPNELIRLAKLAKRLKQKLIVLTDSTMCPIIPAADASLIAPSSHIPLFGTPTSLSCLINYLVMELASRYGPKLKKHQQKLEQSYWENDVLFSMKTGV